MKLLDLQEQIRKELTCLVDSDHFREFLHKELLRELQSDDDVRAAVQAIQGSKVDVISGYQETMQLPAPAYEQIGDGVKEETAGAEHFAQDAEKIALYQQIQTLHQQINKTTSQLTNMQQEKEDVKAKCHEIYQAYGHLKETSKQELAQAELRKMQLENKLRAMKDEVASLQSEKEELAAANAKLEQQVNESFPKERALYQQSAAIEANRADMLRAVFPRDGFETFIVGLSQERSLPKLWDVLRDAILRGGSQKECAYLWNLFQHALRLVNAGKETDIYTIIETREGDEYDRAWHMLTPDSRAQGDISRVVLPGYQNNYLHKVERKSLVYL